MHNKIFRKYWKNACIYVRFVLHLTSCDFRQEITYIKGGPLRVIIKRQLTLVRTSYILRRFVMNDIIKNIEVAQLKTDIADFKVGDTVKVSAKVKEGNRERIQVFEGTVIKRQGGSNRETFTVRKSSNGVGVEKTWPLHSPIVEKIEVVRHGKVRRAKLYYLRNRVGKAARVKELVK